MRIIDFSLGTLQVSRDRLSLRRRSISEFQELPAGDLAKFRHSAQAFDAGRSVGQARQQSQELVTFAQAGGSPGFQQPFAFAGCKFRPSG